MLTSKRPSLWLIREAVLKNTCRPLPEESDPLDRKALRVSSMREGDSQLGLMIFIGLATHYGYGADEISLAEGIEEKVIRSKSKKFHEKWATKMDGKFVNKVKLVSNYINLK